MQNRGSENAIYGTRFLFGRKYGNFRTQRKPTTYITTAEECNQSDNRSQKHLFFYLFTTEV